MPTSRPYTPACLTEHQKAGKRLGGRLLGAQQPGLLRPSAAHLEPASEDRKADQWLSTECLTCNLNETKGINKAKSQNKLTGSSGVRRPRELKKEQPAHLVFLLVTLLGSEHAEAGGSET